MPRMARLLGIGVSVLFAGVLVFASLASGGRTEAGDAGGSPLRRLLSSVVDEEGLDRLASVEGNEGLLTHTLARGDLERVRAMIGKDVFRRLGLEDAEGLTLEEVLRNRKDSLKKWPNAVMALLRRVEKSEGRDFRLSDEEGSSVRIPEPARLIPADKLYEYALGPSASAEAMRRYLRDNFGVQVSDPWERPDEAEAFSVFLNFVRGIREGDLGENGEDRGEEGMKHGGENISYFEDVFLVEAGSTEEAPPPGEDAPPVFLPSEESLRTMRDLLLLRKKMREALAEGEDPSRVTLPSGRDAAWFARRFGVELDSLAGVTSDSDVDALVRRMFAREVVSQIRGPNAVVFDSSTPLTGEAESGESPSTPTGSPADSVLRHPPIVSGTGEADRRMDEAAERLAGPLSETERLKLELEYGMFHFRLSPDQLGEGGKTYDPIFVPFVTDGYLALPSR